MMRDEPGSVGETACFFWILAESVESAARLPCALTTPLGPTKPAAEAAGFFPAALGFLPKNDKMLG
jgi:hypothetical protein